MCSIIVFWLGSDRTSEHLFLYFFLFTSFHTHVSLRAYFCLSHFILSVPMHECLGKRSWMSSTFPIAILNGTCFFSTDQLQVHNAYSERKVEIVKHQ